MSTDSQGVLLVAGLIQHEGQVLLVRRQSSKETVAYWALPGGEVDPGELLSETLCRTVREETGLTVQLPGQLMYVAQLQFPSLYASSSGPESPSQAVGSLSTAFVFEVNKTEGVIVEHSASGYVREARFFSLEDAIDELGQMPWRFMREPVVAYLRGDVTTGSVWLYRRQPDERDELIARLPEKVGSVVTLEARQDGRQRNVEPELRPQHTFVVLGCLMLLLVFAVLIVIGIISVHK